MKTTRRIWFHIVSIALLWLFGSVMTATGVAFAQGGQEDRDHFRGQWDFVKGIPGTMTAAPGGTATASAQDGSRIILTGGGTFNLPSGRVTGGGTWQTQDAAGAITGNGRYRVTSFVKWEFAPGAITCPPFGDTVGNCEDVRGGLLVLTVDYLDGTEGIIAISCQLLGAPVAVFEGMIGTKGFVAYMKREKTSPDDSNTLFHIQFRK